MEIIDMNGKVLEMIVTTDNAIINVFILCFASRTSFIIGSISLMKKNIKKYE